MAHGREVTPAVVFVMHAVAPAAQVAAEVGLDRARVIGTSFKKLSTSWHRVALDQVMHRLVINTRILRYSK